jgi:hypothetical protein
MIIATDPISKIFTYCYVLDGFVVFKSDIDSLQYNSIEECGFGKQLIHNRS